MSDQENKPFTLDSRHLQTLRAIRDGMVRVDNLIHGTARASNKKTYGDIDELEVLDILIKSIEKPGSIKKNEIGQAATTLLQYTNQSTFKCGVRLYGVIKKNAVIDGDHDKFTENFYGENGLKKDLIAIRHNFTTEKLDAGEFFLSARDHSNVLKGIEKVLENLDSDFFHKQKKNETLLNSIKVLKGFIKDPSTYRNEDVQQAITIFLMRRNINENNLEFVTPGLKQKVYDSLRGSITKLMFKENWKLLNSDLREIAENTGIDMEAWKKKIFEEQNAEKPDTVIKKKPEPEGIIVKGAELKKLVDETAKMLVNLQYFISLKTDGQYKGDYNPSVIFLNKMLKHLDDSHTTGKEISISSLIIAIKNSETEVHQEKNPHSEMKTKYREQSSIYSHYISAYAAKIKRAFVDYAQSAEYNKGNLCPNIGRSVLYPR